MVHGKNGFAERSKNFSWIGKAILLNQNNYVERSNQLLEYQNFLQHRSLFLRFQQNYFDGPTKLFSSIYIQQNFRSLGKIVFFLCSYLYNYVCNIIFKYVIY